ncbi:hypothetical protein MCOR27_004342 [Pyricularia oryzae]|uniref:SH3 domain-containing protein n=2 Tax=Pyricularia TaxID=48558 RepID=A0ABQ8NFE5_PYRGI|nr:hypothetical protein MCOR02_007330 [Pyricularia oryzae]KAI6296171.1 hypothetical protein MCOR33_007144 [Pyricularia grisea]KAI6258560.1 hypothetical protein MCOR19_005085 [Pyricularia oryzae]KAI6281138.1 hypothetical protein MCOR27_004342 [Pyricularia oryzae]KAI6282324.1 hypothetical protein MCOR26_002898 [Pyricularia oryzae]
MSAPFMVKALFEYSSPHEDDLPFPAGQIITVTEVEDEDWYTGEFVGDDGVKHEGIFPRNFVEKYEPVAPPRPTRTRPKKESEPTAATSPPPPAPAAAAAPEPVEEPTPSEPELPLKAESQFTSEPVEEAPTASGNAPAASAASPPAPEPAAPVPIAAPSASNPKVEPQATSPPAPKVAPSASKPSGPPPVAEKPTGNAFKDRIAAFNRAAAPPITPFKPSGLGGSSFIKKPFVAPPPSRNAFVPQPQSAPAPRVYRRDEDPEIKEREQENQETAEKVGLAPTTSNEGEDEDQPKPMSLKERMALLQKQQQEQAQRHAEAAAKKEKPKRPAKKRMESNEGAEEDGSLQIAPPQLERKDSEDTAGRRSIDESQGTRAPPAGRRKSSAKALGGEPYDGNEADMSGAGDTTEGQEDVTEREDSDDRSHHVPKSSVAAGKAPAVDEEDEEEDDEEEEDIDPEVRRKEELRARMAKMSGGMGMAGMFGMPMPGLGVPAKKKKASVAVERRDSEGPEGMPSPGLHAPPVPAMVALPGLATRRSEDRAAEEVALAPAAPKDEEEEDHAETPSQSAQSPPSVPFRMSMSGAPPVPGNRPIPPPVPSEARPPMPPIAGVKSPSAGSESDDELSEHPMQEPLATPRGEPTPASRAPPPPPPGPPPVEPSSPRSPGPKQQIFFGGGGGEVSPTSPTASSMSNKRASRPPPPIPTMPPSSPPPAASRPPPPPPPGGLSRRSTADNRPLSPTKASRKELSDEEEITEYEGDYDTDIASSVPHKDALKSHGRDSSIDETTSVSSPTATAPPTLPPPIPSVNAPRAPPPIPNQPPPAPKTDYRRSVDMPRMAPPPPPPQKEAPQYDDDYDPYNYSAPSQGVSAAPGYAPPPPKSPRSPEIPHTSEAPYQPPPPPPGLQQSGRVARQSLDVGRSSHSGRRSVDIGPSMDSHYVANDIDLAPSSSWWTQPNGLPPQLQGRKDIFFESEQSVSAQGSKSMITRDIYILYHDYSQTVVTVLYDGKNPSDVHLSQRHEPPPRTLRQDQLEQSYERFGRQIAEAVKGKKETVVGDGTPYGLVQELLRPHKDALLPVGTRAYGALVYANMANASTTVNDEIRPGDIMSIRNAKFSGKHGALGHKYSMEVGRPDHVAIVAEWDGSKKKVRAWEQGRESKKTKLESFRLDDLRSGEVKIWRVMPRSWVGWEGQN